MTTLVAASGASASIVLGQIDNFEDGTLMNWGGGASPTNIPDGGPAGFADNFLQITSTGGGGPGSKLASFNTSQWTGDFLSAGVTAVQVDMKNFGVADVEMRGFLFDFGLGGGNYTSLTPITIPADLQWHTVTFSLLPADLAAVDGASDVNATLANVAQFLFRHQPGPPAGQGVGTPIVGQLGIDNVRALPEPSTLTMMAMGSFLLRRRRR